MKKRQTLTTFQTIINLQTPDYERSVSTTISQDKIKFRQKRVNQLRLRGYTYEEIANIIGTSLSTIEKDMHDINELSRKWFEELIKQIEQLIELGYGDPLRLDALIHALKNGRTLYSSDQKYVDMLVSKYLFPREEVANQTVEENRKKEISTSTVYSEQENQIGFPTATIFFAVINIIIFAYGYLNNSQNEIIQNYGFVSDYLFKDGQNPLSDTLVRLFSSMFIHQNLIHIGFNLITLLYIGSYAEKSIKTSRYFFIYLISGISGALFYGFIASYFLGNGDVILIGASGAIAGVLGIGSAAGNVKAFYWFLMQIIFVIATTLTHTISIAFTAHIGGFIVGFIITKLLLIEQKKKFSTKIHE